MPRIDDATTRALAEVRYMPLSYYLEIDRPAATIEPKATTDGLQDDSLSTVWQDQWERLEWLLTRTAIPQRQAA